MNNLDKKIDNRIMLIKQKNNIVSSFFEEIINYNPIIIGGFIRNVINEEESRDIDIVLNNNNHGEIEQLVNKYNLNYKKNQFDSYKITFDDIVIDIWYIENHNLFKKRIYENSVDNLKETTFINYDSLVYEINTKKLDIDYYLECMCSLTIDFVGNDAAIKNNPTNYLSIVKIFNICYKKNMSISKRVNDYILSLYFNDREVIITKLKKEYEKHYNCDMSNELEKYITDYFCKNKQKRLVKTY